MNILSVPVYFTLELTPACNNLCPGCSNVYADDRIPAPLGFAQWKTILDRMGGHAVQIKLTGGEPLLHPDFSEILKAAAGCGASITIFTNGRWRHPSAFIELLTGLSPNIALLISLHGAQAASHEAFSHVPGSFSETLTNIQLAAGQGLSVSTSTVITQQNCLELEQVVDLAHSAGVQTVVFNRYLGPELPGIEPEPSQLRQAVAEIEALLSQDKTIEYGIGIPQCFIPNHSYGCLAGAAMVTVDPWGRLRPCTQSPTLIGSLLDTPLADLWHSPNLDQWRQSMFSNCSHCAALAVCHGGCRALKELRADQCDPLLAEPLTDYVPPEQICDLPSQGHPLIQGTLREESFGYILLGQGQAVPVLKEARPVIDACRGQHTFAEIALEFGGTALNLLGELWLAGLLEIH